MPPAPFPPFHPFTCPSLKSTPPLSGPSPLSSFTPSPVSYHASPPSSSSFLFSFLLPTFSFFLSFFPLPLLPSWVPLPLHCPCPTLVGPPCSRGQDWVRGPSQKPPPPCPASGVRRECGYLPTCGPSPSPDGDKGLVSMELQQHASH